MKNNFKCISVLLVFMLLLSVFSGCSLFRPSSIGTVKLPNGKSVGIPFNDYLYLAYTLHANAESYAAKQTPPITTKELMGQKSQDGTTTYNDYFKDEFKKTLTNNAIVLDKFNEFKYSLSDDDKKAITDQYDQLITQLGAPVITTLRSELRTSETDFKKLIENQVKVNKVYTKMFEKGGTYEIKDEDAKKYYDESYVRVKHILIKTSSSDAQGQSVPYDETKTKEAEKKANDLLARALKGENFENLARYNSEDGNGPDPITDKSVKEDKIDVQQDQQTGEIIYLIENYGYTFGKGKMDPEFEKASFEMKIGDIRLVKSSFGYHIIKKYNSNEKADYFDKLKNNVIGKLQNDKFTSVRDDWAKSYTITFDVKLLDTYSLVNLKDITK